MIDTSLKISFLNINLQPEGNDGPTGNSEAHKIAAEVNNPSQDGTVYQSI